MTKKPEVVEAVQFTGSNLIEVQCLLGLPEVGQELCTDELVIPTPEGDMRALPGDWIVKGDDGEFGLLKTFRGVEP